jgi:outer membrane protein TolC
MPRHAKPCFFSVSAALAASLASSGCRDAGHARIERQVERILGEGSEKILADPVASTHTTPAQYPKDLTNTDRSASALTLRPATTNPAPGDLVYHPAAEKRDVAARLRTYAAAEGLLIAENLEGMQPPDASIPRLSLTDSLTAAQRTGREYRNAEEDFILASIRLLIERHLWGPRLFNDTTLGLGADGANGSFDHALDIINQLKATKRLPYGGSVEAAWIVSATDQLREQATEGYRQSSRLALSGTVPLLRGAGDVAREDLIQAERDLIYQARTFERFRRELLVSIASDYFQLIQSRQAIVNQQRQLQSFRLLERETAAKVAAGRLDAFQVGNASNRVQSALSQLASLVDQHIFRLERFKIRLGLAVDEPISISGELVELPEPEVDVARAAELALDYRLDLQNERDKLDDARRAVANARNALLPDLDLKGELSIPTEPDDPTGGLSISAKELDYAASATFSLPLDREPERLRLRASMIQLQRLARDYEQERDNVIVEVRDSLRRVDNARIQLSIAERQVEINRERLRGLQLQIDTVEPQTIIDAENDLLEAENARDAARTALRNSVLNYLLASDQLRVGRDGTFTPLPGMDAIAPAPAPNAP